MRGTNSRSNNDSERDRYCEKCNMLFVRPSDYVRHRYRTQLHNPKGAKIYPCPECPKMFALKDHVNSHRNTQHHRVPEVCGLPLGNKLSQTCQEEFTHLSTMRKHMESHLKEGSEIWLHDAYQLRIRTLSAKYRNGRVTGLKRQRKLSKASTPPDSFLPTPIPSAPTPTVQVHNADTMEPLGSQTIIIKNDSNGAHPSTGKPKLTKARRSQRQRPTDCYSNQSTSPSSAYSNLPSAIELFNVNDTVFKSPPVSNIDNVQLLSLPTFGAAQAPSSPNPYMATAPSLPTVYMDPALSLPNVYMTQALPSPNGYTDQAPYLPNAYTYQAPSPQNAYMDQVSSSPNAYMNHAPSSPNACTTQVMPLPNICMDQVSSLPKVYITQAPSVLNVHTAQALSVPNLGMPAELPGSCVTQHSYSSNFHLPHPSFFPDYYYGETTNPAFQGSCMGAGALESFGGLTEFQNYQTSFPDNSSGILQTAQPIGNQYFSSLVNPQSRPNLGQPIVCMPTACLATPNQPVMPLSCVLHC